MIQIRCHNPQQAHSDLACIVWPAIKGQLLAGGRPLTVEVREERRSDAENRLLHAMLTHISKTMEWAGKKRDVETWKRLLVAAWCRANNEQVELLPALDGHGVDIVFRRTSQLTRAECADLISFIFAWGSDNGIEFPERPQIEAPRRASVIDLETGEIMDAEQQLSTSATKESTDEHATA